MDIFNRFSTYFDGAVKNMQKMTADQVNSTSIMQHYVLRL